MLRKRLSQAIGRVVAAYLIVMLAPLPRALAAGKYKTLYRFNGRSDGQFPSAGVIFDTEGNLYGTTFSGGTYSYGTVFKLTPSGNGNWKENVIYTFGHERKRGVSPYAGLVFDSGGHLYGTTESGGTYEAGTVFTLKPNKDGTWTEIILHSFNGTNEINPIGELIFDLSGNLYGTTRGAPGYGLGTVFKLTPNPNGSWTESVLHSFSGTDGAAPAARLIFDTSGNLYGTTVAGGAVDNGTVFELMPNQDGSWKESVLHSFHYKDGIYPYSSLIFDSAGNLYGTTVLGGSSGNGTVFKLTLNKHGRWKESVLHSFDQNGGDGFYPYAGLILDSAENLYGTTSSGGAYEEFGTIFKLTRTKGGWAESVLHSFRDLPGARPIGGLISDGQGTLFGTTSGDGFRTWGSVFEITP
jgi:uncharacterized repeat protein (TIGR03803 family)